ncbi:nucleotidyltransferase domain-containing protein [Paenibacillus macquariensis]|uniref:Nucleotidyltransferase domain-containing protein n=1 Tax=Paenibacillus macquariensis TaxID=948756 RepID=A0ABY1K8Z2_9BACL|nr:nucleotidyltransferase domain-containing protein [Paenibacillus macquariensis]MEC0091508.1 nucleotidyltransferase domain-containing protein [Paenibacillus macquariensis]OAB26640.1 hypothetical protein PMSM_26090 [Paenibacillus macquariensis subsp. macquariensis]SIR43811.1 Nucleotidyltransferase domain-containing protein [Paenibacillus macquariensis]
MWEHHAKTIQNLVSELHEDKRYLALIIGGSIAKGREREDSDVDIILVVTDEEFQRRELIKDFHYCRNDVCTYPNGYIDGTVVNLRFLYEVAERGNEPTRAAYVGAFVAYSHVPDLEKLIQKIPIYLEHEQKEKIESFYAHLEASRWFVPEAEKRNDKYLLGWAINELILYGGRMILAHNKILYPYHKWFLTELQNAKNKPDNFLDLINNLLNEPNHKNSEKFCNAILEYTEWDKPTEGWVSRFREESEWHWLKGHAPLKDR